MRPFVPRTNKNEITISRGFQVTRPSAGSTSVPQNYLKLVRVEQPMSNENSKPGWSSGMIPALGPNMQEVSGSNPDSGQIFFALFYAFMSQMPSFRTASLNTCQFIFNIGDI